VLAANGVLFAGIMAFVYSDLMVPPLVAINAKYYGWRVALYVAAVMYVSIVVTALGLHAAFAATGLTPEGGRAVSDVARISLDYSFWLNVGFALVAAVLVWLARQHERKGGGGDGRRLSPKRLVALACLLVVAGGLVVSAFGVRPVPARDEDARVPSSGDVRLERGEAARAGGPAPSLQGKRAGNV